jgi:hypothetical protein
MSSGMTALMSLVSAKARAQPVRIYETRLAERKDIPSKLDGTIVLPLIVAAIAT